MTKRGILAAVVLATGVAMLGAVSTAPIGAALVAGGLYLLALPHIGRQRTGGGPTRGRRGRI